MDDKVDQ